MNHIDIIRERGRAYRNGHPAYVRQSNLPMIDLTKHLPTQEILTPISRPEQSPSFLQDAASAFALAAMVIGIIYLVFGL